MAVPHFVIDAPEGGGKIPLLPSDYLVDLTTEQVTLRNYEGKVYLYPQADGAQAAVAPANGNGKRRELPMVGSSSTGCSMADALLE
jgi:lysine 2,3-aminomutase